MIPAFQQLTDAIEELEVWCDYHEEAIPAEQLPSALVLAVDPRSKPNATARIQGNCDHLVQALLVAARGNDALRNSLINAIPEFLNLL